MFVRLFYKYNYLIFALSYQLNTFTAILLRLKMSVICRFCKDAGKSSINHYLKNKDGQVICPTLLATVCSYCKQNAHTIKYCPALIAKESSLAKKKEKREREERKNIIANTNNNIINNTNTNNNTNNNPVNKLIANKFSLLDEVIDDTRPIQVNVAVGVAREIKRPVQINVKVNELSRNSRFVPDDEEW